MTENPAQAHNDDTGESIAERQAAKAAADKEALSKYDDSRRPLTAAAKKGALALLILVVISLLAWGGKAGLAGIWGVVLGGAIGGGFVLITVLLVWATARTTPVVTGVVVMGGWLLKIVALIAVLAIISDMAFYDRWAFFVTVLAALVVTLAAEVWGMSQENLTYVGSK